MAILTLCSAAGAPGVTTTALALTLAWPQPAILVDADPNAAKALLAGYLQGHTPPAQSMVDLAIADRHGELQTALPTVLIPLPNSKQQILPGIHTPEQATTTQALWPTLMGALAALDADGVDIIIDAGRVGAQHAPTPTITGADTALLTMRSTLPAIAAAKAWAPIFTNAAASAAGLCIIGAGHPYSAKDISKNLEKLPVLATIAQDPVTAEVFSLGKRPGRHFETAALVRTARAAAETLHKHIHARHEELQATS